MYFQIIIISSTTKCINIITNYNAETINSDMNMNNSINFCVENATNKDLNGSLENTYIKKDTIGIKIEENGWNTIDLETTTTTVMESYKNLCFYIIYLYFI